VSGDLSGAILARKPLCPMGLRVICRVSGAQEEKDAGAVREERAQKGHKLRPTGAINRARASLSTLNS